MIYRHRDIFCLVLPTKTILLSLCVTVFCCDITSSDDSRFPQHARLTEPSKGRFAGIFLGVSASRLTSLTNQNVCSELRGGGEEEDLEEKAARLEEENAALRQENLALSARRDISRGVQQTMHLFLHRRRNLHPTMESSHEVASSHSLSCMANASADDSLRLSRRKRRHVVEDSESHSEQEVRAALDDDIIRVSLYVALGP